VKCEEEKGSRRAEGKRKHRGNIEDERREVGGRSEAGRRKVGDKSEECH
jgi:hypothetical protein